MMIRLKNTPISGFYLFEVNSLIKKSLLLQLVAFKIYAIIKTFYCSNWLPMVSVFFLRAFLPMKTLIRASTLIVKNLAEANTFLENNKMINIIFDYIFGLTFQSPFSK